MSDAVASKSSSRSRKEKEEMGNPDTNLAGIGNYIFQKTVGEGNFAKVKSAKHKLTGAEVAIKVIDKTSLDEKKLSKLYREVRIMKLLHHPNIVKLYEVIETKSTVFLVMEYASGGELYDYLVVHGKLKEKEARAKFRQILSAVSYCHKKRVIHRDLKAENLLLDANLDIKIADFGFSNYFDPESKLDTFCGSPPYAAPELFQGRRYTGPEVDIWSLGVILYVLTTGCLPFDGKNLQEMRESVCRGKYRIPFYLTDSCEKLLRKFLVRDPYKRAGLDMLIDDAWINEGYTDSPISTDVSQTLEGDETIIRIIESKYHIDRETILKGIRDNVYDDILAIYYLLYYEKATRENFTAELAISPVTHVITDAPSSSRHGRNDSGASPNRNGNGMMRIDEDGILPTENAPPANEGDAPEPQSRPIASAKPRRRRFTVGGEADMQKLADDDEEGTALLRQVVPAALPSKTDEPALPNIETKPLRPASAGASTDNSSVYATTRRPQTTSSITVVSTVSHPVQLSGTSASTASSTAQDASGAGQAEPLPQQASTIDRPQTRKRHNTIVGILRGGLRRPTENGLPPVEDSPAYEDEGGENGSANLVDSNGTIRLATDDNKPRSLRFTFNSNTTSSKPPDEIVQQVVAACAKHGMQAKPIERFLVLCSISQSAPGNDGVRFEIEICKLPRLKNLHGLRFKRVSGASADYKDLCEKVLASLQL